MADKFRDKYRIPSARLKGWDYGSNAAYFVTICTRLMVQHFGKIAKSEMQLNQVGEIAQKFWYEIPEHFPFIWLDAFVVMPNHIHGIIIINKSDESIQMPECKGDSAQMDEGSVQTPNLGVSKSHHSEQPPDAENDAIAQTPNLGVITHKPADIMQTDGDALQTPDSGVSTPKFGGKNPKWKPGTLGVILNQFKRICTINIRKLHPDFEWQERYHDHIVRNTASFQRIQNYILHNPENWDKDKYFTE